MQRAPEPGGTAGQIAGLSSRHRALQQAAMLPGADQAGLLDAALTELELAIDSLAQAQAQASQPASQPGRPAAAAADSAERRLLRAVFADAPVPLFLLAADGTVQRANKAAAALLGSKPGYATGRQFAALVNLQARAAVHTQLTATARTGKTRRMSCSLLGAPGPVASELVIGTAGVRGEIDQLIVAVLAAASTPAGDSTEGSHGAAGSHGADQARAGGSQGPDQARAGGAAIRAVEAITHRLDMVTAVTRLLLEGENFSETATLRRCAGLLASELAAWVIVDIERRNRLRRQFVIGPPDEAAAELIRAISDIDPVPGSLPAQVHDSGQAVLITHPEDPAALGAAADGVPLLALMTAASVLSVPLWDGENRYGVLTLARRAPEGRFELADLGLVEELGEQLALAIRVDRMFRRRTEIADALQASLLPRRLPEIPGAQIAAAYVAATEGAEVGGDFYDVYRTPDGWGMAVGDVCGKGEEAAAVTAAARHAIRVIAHRDSDPAAVLAVANDIMIAEDLDGGFVTAAVAHFQWEGSSLRARLASAGQPGPVLIRPDGRTTQTRGGGQPLGLFPDARPGAEELIMTEGDLLFCYSDGVTEARSPDREPFGDLLVGELTRLAGADPDDVVAAVHRLVLEFSGANLADDMTMLVLKAGEPPR